MLLEQWQKEKDTLHHLSQILGKHALVSAYQQPQWEHVVLDITVQGFSTGLLHSEHQDYSLSVNLMNHRIEVVVGEHYEEIPLKYGNTIKYYYETIKDTLERYNVHVEINTTPQEVADPTPFEQNEHMYHYDNDIAKEALKFMKFAYNCEASFIAPLRTRKVKPGLFWGTFDISCIVVYGKYQPFDDPNRPIEQGAFDEEMIEFGFWFGDDTFKGPTFYVLPYPFSDKIFSCNEDFPNGSRYNKDLGEFIIEIEEANNQSIKDIEQFFTESFNIFKSYLNWRGCDHYFIPLNMQPNSLD